MKVKIGIENTSAGGKVFLVYNHEINKFGDFKTQQEKNKCIKYLKNFYKSKHGLKCEILREI